MIRVYLFCGEGRPWPEKAADLLPAWRRQRYDRLRREESRRESLRAGLLYAYAMNRWGIDPAWPVTVLPAGKPVLEGREDVYFSLSHSGDWAMCALSDKPVGVDIQRRRAVKRTMARQFHPQEQAWLETLPAQTWEAEFFRLWTRKEAWVKAVSGGDMLSLSAADVIHPLPGLYFQDHVLPGGYCAAVCAGDKNICQPVKVEEKALLTEFL